MSLIVTIQPSIEPVSLAEAKLHVRVDSATVEDSLINVLIMAARQAAETELQSSLLPQTLKLTLDCFDSVVKLPKGPVSAVSSVKYLDMASVQQTLANTEYALDLAQNPGRITPKFGKIWPVTLPQIAAVEISYIAGYADAASVPAAIKQWILLHVADWYYNREASTEGRFRHELLPNLGSLLDPYRSWTM